MPEINQHIGTTIKTTTMRLWTFFLMLFCLSPGGFAQETIENPRFGMANVNYLKLTRIELLEQETILSFTAKPPSGGWIAIDEKSYISVVGDSSKLMITRADGVEFGKQYPGSQYPELSYRLFFPPLDKSVSTIDFGELVANNPWQIFDIELRRVPGRSLVPDNLLGNWFNVADGRWEISLSDSVVVFKAKNWKFQEVESGQGIYKITLTTENESAVIYAMGENENGCRIGTTPGNLVSCTNLPGKVEKWPGPEESFSEDIFNSGHAIYRGYIRGFTPRSGTSTGTLTYFNSLTSEMESHLIQIGPDGTFQLKIPLDHPRFVSVKLPTGSESLFLEPGKTLYQLKNTGIEGSPSLFSGESGRVNHDLKRTDGIKMDERNIWSVIPDMDFGQYVAFLKENEVREGTELDRLKENGEISQKAWHLRKLELDVKTALHAILYNNYRMMAELFNQGNSPDNQSNPVYSVPVDKTDMRFISKTPVNHSHMFMINDYFNLLSILRSFNPERHFGSYYQLTVQFRDQIVSNGGILTGEESDMFEYIKLKLVDNYNNVDMQNFSKAYGNVMRAFQSKYQDEWTKMSDQYFATNFRENIEVIFGIKEGFAFDVVHTKDYLSRLKNSDISEDEFRNTRNLVSDPFLKEKVIEGYYARKSQIDARKSQTEYVPETEADKQFDRIVKKYRGKLVYVDFWATWCAPCREGIERIKPLKAELADSKDIVFLYITNHTSPIKDYEAMLPGIKGEHVKLSQDEWNFLVQKFNIFGIPHYALIDRKGRVIMNNMRLENGPLKKLLIENL
jgi:thiol-disulfide isomerase/thioredoxin